MTHLNRANLAAACLLLIAALAAHCGRRRPIDTADEEAKRRAANIAAFPDAARALVRPEDGARQHAGARHRLLCARLPRRRHGAAGRWAELAGDAAQPQPKLGPPRPDRLSRGSRPRGAEDHGLAGPARRRYLAAAGRADADRPRLPPDRPRRRSLADADAAQPPRWRGAREHARRQHGQSRLARRRSETLDAGPYPADQGRRQRAARRAHLRQSGHQGRALPGSGRRSLMAQQGPADLGP